MSGAASPTLFVLLAQFEREPLLAPSRGPSKATFHALRRRGWLSLDERFDSHRRPIRRWQITEAGKQALAEHRNAQPSLQGAPS